MFIDETRELGGGIRVGSKIDPIYSGRSVTTLRFLRNNAFGSKNGVAKKKLARPGIFDGAHLKGRSSID